MKRVKQNGCKGRKFAFVLRLAVSMFIDLCICICEFSNKNTNTVQLFENEGSRKSKLRWYPQQPQPFILQIILKRQRSQTLDTPQLVSMS